MAIESLFHGAALQAVDGDGALQLPPFVLSALARRTEARRLLFSPHELDPCMSGYDEGHAARLYDDIERRRLRDEDWGLAAERHHRRARRTFGAAEAASYDEAGRVVLPAMLRRRSGIGAAALVVGTGAAFEIWNPETARDCGDEELKALADFALGEQAKEGSEVKS